ncbi:hypothetical protein JCM5350_008249 [Sporobolomyces pararoseus]
MSAKSFNRLILEGPLQRGIRVLSFGGAQANHLNHFLLHVFPKLRSFSAIINLQEHHLHHLFSEKIHSPFGDQAKVGQCVAALLQLAAQTSHLQIFGLGGSLAKFVTASGPTLRSLEITPLSSENVLGTPNLGYLDILASLPQLEKLTVRSTAYYPNSLSKFIAEEALVAPLPFANSLSSLNLACQSINPTGIPLTLLLFVARFPSLSHLGLPRDGLTLPTNTITKIRLSQLRHLEIANSSILTYSSLIYRHLDTLALKALTLKPRIPSDQIHDDQVDLINLNLAPVRQSLRSIDFPRQCVSENAKRSIGGSRVLVISLPSRRTFDNLMEKIENPDIASEDESDESDTESDSEEEDGRRSRRRFPPRSKAGDNLAFQGVEDLSSWISEKLQDLRIKDDIDGAKSLARTLKSTAELRKWLND